ncbi:stage V sporulation protein AA [Pullulanibacillus pueri]|uniref:Stage V sporulation protein AA n=1 Tax=Pullulanibacillus pueri TaxID=1437324 RepID=A0A8J2ZVI0_9BACL|nr:stage V sporulation protein AA [Pullulanibacillus pueri]MBM7681522.1 stage V sporulation protein AA [Pullulanibacillus pueri]GGH79216.1 stage V sporulation protein AA [Pullulanibacillus pueri]
MESGTITIYIRLRHKISGVLHETLTLDRLAQVIAPEKIKSHIDKMVIHQIKQEDNSYVVIDAMDIIRRIYQHYPNSDIQTVGPSQTIVVVSTKPKKARLILFALVWILLFIGAGLTIMNFHEDVAMQEVHQKIYTMVTGKVDFKPLILQIPYSIGIGIGMILFFNHIFKKRFNEEPSPLEVEMFNYEQDLDRYIAFHEKEKNEVGNHRD